MTDTNGDSLGTIKYYPYGGARSGDVPTDKKFTGQRLDDTGLYYYGARYYDASIGRFISADTIVPDPANPQAFNRYSYCLNNPLKYIDPSGNQPEIDNGDWIYIPGVGWVDRYSGSAVGNPSGEEAPEDNQSPATNLPLVDGEYKIVWGYIGQGGFCYQYQKSVIIVESTEGYYYKIETTGHGLLLDAAVSLKIFKPNDILDIYTLEGWGFEFNATLIAFADVDIGITFRFDSEGVSKHPSEWSYMAFSSPGIGITVKHTDIKLIRPNELFNDMPIWVMNAYDNIYGINYRQILKY